MTRSLSTFCFVSGLGLAGVAFAVHAAAEDVDVYVLAGQSNMDGRASVQELASAHPELAEPNPGIPFWYANNHGDGHSTGWINLAPGYSVPPGFGKGPGTLPSGTFGMEISFGPAMAEASDGRRVALVKVSRGGTSLHLDWRPGSERDVALYPLLMKTIEKALASLEADGDTGHVRGFLWHQGESDGGNGNAEKYAGRFHGFLKQLRGDLGLPGLPVVIGEVIDNGKRDGVRAALREVAEGDPLVALVTTEGLTSADGTHFDTESLLTLGGRYAEAMQELLAAPSDQP